MIPMIPDMWDVYLTLVRNGWKKYRRMTGR